MKVLKRNISKERHNYTRFVIVSKEESKGKSDKSSMVFILKHSPGKLHDALDCFADNGVNLLHLQSRPIPSKPWEYSFYVDCAVGEGKELNRVLHELREHTIFAKLLGCYRRAVFKGL
jgi:prephenate dehydratase